LRRDLFVRVFHGLFALGLVANYWLLEPGEDPHEWVGWAIAVAIVLRVIWGWWRPAWSRVGRLRLFPMRLLLTDVRSLADGYAEQEQHSVAGSWMIVLMFVLAAALILTGWMQDLDAYWGEEWLQNLHLWLGHGLVIAAGMHIAAVLIIQFRHGVPLVRRVWFG